MKTNKGGNRSAIPDSILNNKELNAVIAACLPSTYNFEIHKTIWRLVQAQAKITALQFPEGLIMFAPLISDILGKFANVETLLMADVTYGACCVDDFAAAALGADFLVHYGHSCLVPLEKTSIPNMLYVFVEIQMDVDHFTSSIKQNLPSDKQIALAGTIQFVPGMQASIPSLKEYFKDVLCPQARPLSKGEVLGCTAPSLPSEIDAIVFISDGRFHLEALMIQNPQIKDVYKYDPYSKKLTLEEYNHEEMHQVRKSAISSARNAKKFGLILGSLGRQGNPEILDRVEAILRQKKIPFITVLLSEIFPSKLDMFEDIDAWVQIACPRLSVDWGYAFTKPLLTPYEVMTCLEYTTWRDVYPMDNYSKETGPWGNYFSQHEPAESTTSDKKGMLKDRILAARARRDQQKNKRIEISITE